MVVVCDVWSEQCYSEYFAACRPPSTEGNIPGALIFIPLPRREWQQSAVGKFADDDHLTICTNKNWHSCIVARVVCDVVPTMRDKVGVSVALRMSGRFSDIPREREYFSDLTSLLSTPRYCIMTR